MRHCYTTFAWLALISLTGFILLNSCDPKQSGERRVENLGFWSLKSFEDETKSLDSAEVVYLTVDILDHGEGELRESMEYQRFVLGDDPFSLLIKSRFVGDSLHLRSPNNIFSAQFSDTLDYHIRIDRALNRSDLRSARLRELEILGNISQSDSVRTSYIEKEGLFFRVVKRTNSRVVEEGKELVINYRGYTLNKDLIDDTYSRKSPLRFVFGQEDQVIRGLELVLSEMRAGEIVYVILPSWLAFGSDGSAQGYIQPYTPLFYELQVMEVGY
jgi:hypothetical protein